LWATSRRRIPITSISVLVHSAKSKNKNFKKAVLGISLQLKNFIAAMINEAK
jgi:hypothetical protein